MAARQMTNEHERMSTRVCLADWDGTLRRGYVIRHWMQHLLDCGLVDKTPVEMIASYFELYDAKKLSYAKMARMVVNTYAKSQRGLSSRQLEPLAQEFVEGDTELFSFTAPLINYLNEIGVEVLVITGAPALVLKHFANKFRIGRYYGLELVADGMGRFVGNVARNTALEEQKRAIVNLIKREQVRIVLALGDSRADGPLFDAAPRAYYINGNESRIASDVQRSHLQAVSPETMLSLVTSGRVLSDD